MPGATDIVADRIVGKPYLEFHIDRDKIARYGVNIRDVQDVIEMAIGGENISQSVEGRERYPIRVRYLREFREDIPELERILLPTSTDAQIPLAQLVNTKSVLGPQEIKGERGLLVGYVTMNTRDRDEVSVVEDAERLLQSAVASGELVIPRMVDGVEVTPPEGARPLERGEVEALRSMLRSVVTDGSGRALADVPGPPVIAKTGTAEFGAGEDLQTHAWMIGAQGDLAVAVFVQVGASGSRTAPWRYSSA